MIKRFLSAVLFLALSAAPVLAVNLNGAGATFPAPIYSKWFNQYAKETGVQVNYQGIGSGGGIRQFSAGVVDFGGSDAFMTNKEISDAGGNVLHVPTVMGAVAVVYNLPELPDLKLDPETLTGIFLGDITKWNDPRIAGLNPKASLPAKDITTVHRSDASGTTSIFTNYLAKVSAAWASRAGEGKSINWPGGVGGKGNFGVAGVVKQVSGSIGYVELAYALENKLATAGLKNRAGRFVAPSLAATSAAAASLAKIPPDFNLNLNNAPGAGSYPIVGATWIIVRQKTDDKAKGEALKKLLTWCLTEGQKHAAGLNYAALPGDLAGKALAAVSTIN